MIAPFVEGTLMLFDMELQQSPFPEGSIAVEGVHLLKKMSLSPG
jgi:hypothetical protein